MQKEMVGLNKVYLSNALDLLKKIPDETIDLILVDPPYNVGKDYGNSSDKQTNEEYKKFTDLWMEESYRILKKGGTIYTFGGKQNISYMFEKLKSLNMNYISWIVWHYTQGQGRTKGFSSRHDDILMFSKGGNYKFNLDNIRIPQKFYRKRNNMKGANPGDVWKLSHIHYCEPGRTNHPTQKPHALYERMILASSDEGDVILDPFAGSGSSLEVARITNRNFIGIEIEEEYVSLIKENLKRETKYFNSYFDEILRIPQNLTRDIQSDYLNYHSSWFLEKYHSNLIEKFEKNIIDDYGEEVFMKYRSLVPNENSSDELIFLKKYADQ